MKTENMFAEKDLVELVAKLNSFDTANSFLVPGSPDELEGQEFAKQYLNNLGIETVIEQINSSTHYNQMATIKGIGGGRDLTLYAHMDTVGYELWKDRALKASLNGDKLTGLGTWDDKGHCAVMMMVAKALTENRIQLKGDLHLCFCSDEEGESQGAFAYVESHKPEACIILEGAPPEEINICHQGFGWLKIKVFGKAGHGSAGGTAVDAIANMAEVIVRMQKNQRDNYAKKPHPMNGETVYHTGYIKGGTDFASYPSYCELGIEIGTQPGETMDDRIQEIQAIFDEIKQIEPSFTAEIEPIVVRSPFQTKGAEDLYEISAKAIEKHVGIPAKGCGDNSWGDAQIFQDGGFPTIGFGAPGGNMHAPDEWVSVSGLVNLTKTVIDIVMEYCGVSE